MMERLHFDNDAAYNAVESSHHVARYVIARSACSGQRILDIACGEGYGAYILKSLWKAREVVGIDISEEAISSARRTFDVPNVSFEVGSVYDISQKYPPGRFDVIISLETIEHLEDPERFLLELKALSTPDTTIIISCPNDPYYYLEETSRNPFHIRKYTYQQFFDMTETVLGSARKKFIGTPISGYGNFQLTPGQHLPFGADLRDIVSVREDEGGNFRLLSEDSISVGNTAYFVGAWGPGADEISESSITWFPCDMRSSRQAAREKDVDALSDEVRHLSTALFDLRNGPNRGGQEHLDKVPALSGELDAERQGARKVIDDLKRENRRLGLRSQALLAENELVRDRIWRAGITNQPLNEHHNLLMQERDLLIQERDLLMQERDLLIRDYQALRREHEQMLAAVPWRAVAIYRRVGAFIPRPLLRTAAKLFDYLKHMRN